MRVALFCSGKGSHLETVNDFNKYYKNLNIEPVFFFTNDIEASCYDKALKMWPSIEARAMYPILFESRDEYDKEVRKMMDPYNIDLILFLGYMRIVTPVFLEGAPPIINIHPRLLPAFKSKNAIQQAIDAGVEITRCTAHYVTEELNGGLIISQEFLNIKLRGDYSDKYLDIHIIRKCVLC